MELLTGHIKGRRIFIDVQEQCTRFSSIEILEVVERHCHHNFSQMHLYCFSSIG